MKSGTQTNKADGRNGAGTEHLKLRNFVTNRRSSPTRSVKKKIVQFTGVAPSMAVRKFLVALHSRAQAFFVGEVGLGGYLLLIETFSSKLKI